MAVWAKGAKNCHFLRTSWSSRPPSPSLHAYQGVCPSPSPTATFKDCPNWPWEEIKCGPASGVWPELRVPQPAACRGTVGLLRTRDTVPLTSPSLQGPIAHIQGISLFSPGLLPKRVGVPLSQMNPANSCINPYAEARTASSAPEDSGHIQPGFWLKPHYTHEVSCLDSPPGLQPHAVLHTKAAGTAGGLCKQDTCTVGKGNGVHS